MSHRNRFSIVLCACAMLVNAAAANADTGGASVNKVNNQSFTTLRALGPGPTLNTSVDESKRVKSKLLSVRIVAEAKAKSAVKAQNEVASKVSAALSNLPKSVKAETSGYTAYNDSHGNWQVREMLSLRDAPRKVLLAAADKASDAGMALDSLNFGVPSQVRDRVEKHLITKAVHQWRAKAMAMAQAAGCKRIAISKLQTGRNPSTPRPVQFKAMAHASNVSVPDSSQVIRAHLQGQARAFFCE